MKKRILAISLALSMLLGTVSVAAADVSDFSDMPDNFATDSLLAAVENGLLSGNTNGEIMPYDNLTRAQMATILVRAFGGEDSADLSAFADVSSSAWYYDDLSSAVAMGIFQGNGDAMNPDDAITRQQAFVVLARAFALGEGDTSLLDAFDDGDQVSDWATAEVAAMVATGYVQGNGTNLYPNDTISRQEFAVVMDRMVETYISDAGDYTDLTDGSVMVNTPDVTLSDLTINGDLILGDGVGDGDITLDNVIVTGHMVVRGGGMNSIIITGDSEVQGTVKVAKVNGEVRVSVEGNASVGVIYVNDGLDDIIVEGAFESLVVDYSSIVYAVNATIETIDVHTEEATVILSEGTTVGTATIHETATNAQIILEDDTAVGTITVSGADATVTVEDGAAVETVVITETATDATIEVEDGATIETVEAAAEGTTVTGEGTVESVTVTADNTTVETEGTEVEVADDVSGTTAGGEDVNAGTTTTTESSSSSSSSSGSSTKYLSNYISGMTFTVTAGGTGYSDTDSTSAYKTTVDLTEASGSDSVTGGEITANSTLSGIVFTPTGGESFDVGTEYGITEFLGMVSDSEETSITVNALETLVSNYATAEDSAIEEKLSEKGINISTIEVSGTTSYTVSVSGVLTCSGYSGSVAYTVAFTCSAPDLS